MRPATSIACALCWVVFLAAVILAWRRVLGVETGDINRLWIATVCGFAGMVLISWWAAARDRRR